MVVYVAHAYGGRPENVERAKEVTRSLQLKHLDHCFVCPLLVFSHLEYGEIGKAQEMELCLDLLSICDCILIASEISEGVQAEIDFAKKIGVEVVEFAKNRRDV